VLLLGTIAASLLRPPPAAAPMSSLGASGETPR